LLRVAPVIALGLDINLPDPAKPVEIVDKRAAHEGLQRPEYGCQINPLLHDLVAIHLRIQLRNIGNKGRDHLRELRPLANGSEKLLRVLRQKRDVFAGPVLQHHRNAARRTDAGNRRRRKGKCQPLRQRRQAMIEPLLDHIRGQSLRVALLPRLERDEEKAAVGVVNRAQQAEAHDGVVTGHARRLGQDFLHLPADRIGTLERGGCRKLDVHEEIALVLFRKESGRDSDPEFAGQGGHAPQQDQRNHRLADGMPANGNIAVRRALKHPVEPFEEQAQRSPRGPARPQQQRGERRAERQGIESGNDHRNGDRHGELLV